MSSELLDGVRRGDLEGTRVAITGLAEADRRRPARPAAQLLREVRQAYVARVTGKAWPYQGDVEGVLRCAQVVALETVSAAELRRIGPWAIPADDLAFEALVHRPTSLAELVDAIADQPLARFNSRFALMRSLVRAGRIAAPTSRGYVLAMINGLETRHGPRRPAQTAVRADGERRRLDERNLPAAAAARRLPGHQDRRSGGSARPREAVDPSEDLRHIGRGGSGSSIFLQALRSNDQTRHIPVAILSSYYSRALEDLGLTQVAIA